MPTIMERAFPPCWDGTPPAMTIGDHSLWKLFREKYCHEWIRVWYNVRVGLGSPTPTVLGDELADAWRALTQNRIDAVIETETEMMIVEVRRHAGRSAFGGAILYTQLWNADPIGEKKTVPVIVSDFMPEQMLISCQENGIRVYIV